MGAVLDALSDANEATRRVVLSIVNRLAQRLKSLESDNQRLTKENALLKRINVTL